jgi:hypothetical protein
MCAGTAYVATLKQRARYLCRGSCLVATRGRAIDRIRHAERFRPHIFQSWRSISRKKRELGRSFGRPATAPPFSPAWNFVLSGDVGGFDVGSKFSWQVLALLEHEFCRSRTVTWSAMLGYKALSVDYTQGSGLTLYEYDMTMHGPIFGVTRGSDRRCLLSRFGS